MKFVGKSQPLSQQGLGTTIKLLGVGEAELWTLLSVETQGCGYLPDRRPIILFERHIFHHQTESKYDESNPLISSPIPGGYRGGAGEYERLQEAIALNEHAALSSTSWGIGQIMGLNSNIAGFPTVESMVAAIIDDAIARFKQQEGMGTSSAIDDPLLAALQLRNQCDAGAVP